ncbi:YbhB/YbcL family Raf kinase inhibitor-like protein [Loktanella sp. R86503]|uniref:YbhB/YbcL family Raf kinase inhibitor-like protein n=1 Tax=Loktanella sp. R86503 TaxID=3093847 RepID=UPI0036DE2E18
MPRMTRFPALVIALLCCTTALPAAAQQTPPPKPGEAAHAEAANFTVTSSAFVNGAALPDDLRCTRSGGDGVSPPLSWNNAPVDTQAYAIVMQHYPVGTYPGVNEPSHYWLVWNIPAGADGVARGNPESLGVEGSDKDVRATGYTPPCSPSGAGTHEYTIWVYALDAPLTDLPDQDDISIVWADVMAALKGHVLAGDSITFWN